MPEIIFDRTPTVAATAASFLTRSTLTLMPFSALVFLFVAR